jgi:hypothetical protein
MIWQRISAMSASPGLRLAVWGMYVKTYQDIGLILSGPSDLDEYNTWSIAFDDAGKPVTFVIYKKTAHGLKLGLAGTNQSDEGKRALVDYKARAFHEPGVYGEVSSKLESLARRLKAPVVCAATAKQILGKPVQLEKDGIHYTRNIATVGPVTKVMIGLPLGGEPFTNFENPVCPRTLSGILRRTRRPDPELSAKAELAMLLAERAGI